MRNVLSVVTAGLLLASSSAVLKAQVVDQSNYGAVGNFGAANAWQGQTFRPTATTSVGGGFELFEFGQGASGVLTIALWDALPSTLGASMLASGTAAFNFFAGQRSMIDVFWGAVAVTPGAEYFLAINANESSLASQLSNGNTYANGEAYYNYSQTDPTQPYTCCGAGYDLVFQEFSAPAVTVTPEPASMALLATGLLGVFGAVRRRRHVA